MEEESKTIDVFEDALGPALPPELCGWTVSADRQPGSMFGWGDILLTPDGADAVNQFRRACAARNLAVPKAVMLLLRHYLQKAQG